MEHQTLAIRSCGGGIVKRISHLSAVLFLAIATSATAQERLMLHDGWQIQSSAKAGTDGATISTTAYRPTDWYRSTVPSTVVGSLVEDSVYRDPFFVMNLREMPGASFRFGATCGDTPMDAN